MIFAVLGALANRWRGTDEGTPLQLKRMACGAIVAAPALAGPWPWGALAYAPAAILCAVGFSLPHGPGLDGSSWPRWVRVLYMSGTGLASTVAAAACLWYFGSVQGAAVMAIGGLLKGPCYLLPRGPAPSKFGWRELAFGFCFGLSVDVVLWPRYF